MTLAKHSLLNFLAEIQLYKSKLKVSIDFGVSNTLFFP
jgi:hypothetical protein